MVGSSSGPGRHRPAPVGAPEGVVYCGGGAIKRRIEYRIIDKPEDKWDARVTINGETTRAMTAYSYFGNAKPPRGFAVALLGATGSGKSTTLASLINLINTERAAHIITIEDLAAYIFSEVEYAHCFMFLFSSLLFVGKTLSFQYR